MSDYISRQAAIDAIQIHRENVLGGYEYEEGTAYVYAAAHNHIIDVIKLLPSAQPEQRWIPCSERLPEKSGRYLVTNTRLGAFEVTWNIFYNGKGEVPEGWLYEDGTIAWMPLPEPYKGE